MAVYCEICGSEIKREIHLIRVNSSELRVCKSCAKYGEVKKVLEKNQLAHSAARSPASSPQISPSDDKKTTKIYEQMLQDLNKEEDEDFGRRVKEARERKGWKQEELAQKIHEKQSIIRKIETGDIIPTKELREKLQRVLNI